MENEGESRRKSRRRRRKKEHRGNETTQAVHFPKFSIFPFIYK